MGIEDDLKKYFTEQKIITEKILSEKLSQTDFEKAEKIVREYPARIADQAPQEFFNKYDVMVETHSATIPVDGADVNFVLQATGESPQESSLDELPGSFNYISISPVTKGNTHYFPLYTFYNSGRFEFLNKEMRDPEKINSASVLLNKIEQKLSETHAPVASSR